MANIIIELIIPFVDKNISGKVWTLCSVQLDQDLIQVPKDFKSTNKRMWFENLETVKWPLPI